MYKKHPLFSAAHCIKELGERLREHVSGAPADAQGQAGLNYWPADYIWTSHNRSITTGLAARGRVQLLLDGEINSPLEKRHFFH